MQESKESRRKAEDATERARVLRLIEADAQRRIPQQYDDAWTLLKRRNAKVEAAVETQTEMAWTRGDHLTDRVGKYDDWSDG